MEQEACRYRPQFDVLEDRMMPTAWPSALAPRLDAFTPPPARTYPGAASTAPGVPIHKVAVGVPQNAPPSVLDLRKLVEQSGQQIEVDRMTLAIVGNTNVALVQPRLSESQLILTYTPNEQGKATLAIEAVDTTGASVHLVLNIQVYPVGPTPAR